MPAVAQASSLQMGNIGKIPVLLLTAMNNPGSRPHYPGRLVFTTQFKSAATVRTTSSSSEKTKK